MQRSKPGPKPSFKPEPARRLANAAADGGLPEPDAGLTPHALAHFQRLIQQGGGHLKRADSAALSLLARQLGEEEELRQAMAAMNPAIHPSEYLAARRALTSLQTSASGMMKGLGLTPKSRQARLELEPLPQPENNSQPGTCLPFVNDSGLSDRRVKILADVEWDACAIQKAESEQKRRRLPKPPLTALCHGTQIRALLDSGKPDGWTNKQFHLACQIESSSDPVAPKS